MKSESNARRPVLNLRNPSWVKWVSEPNHTSPGSAAATAVLDVNPDGLKMPTLKPWSGPGCRASPYRTTNAPSRSLKVQPNPKLRPQSRDGLVETAWCLHEPIQQAQHNNEIGKVQKNNKPADHNELWSGSDPYTAFGHCATTPKTRTPRQVKRNPCTTKSQLVSRSEKRAGHHHSLRGRLAKRSSILSICCWNNTSREVFCCSNCFWNWH